jgi:multiple sugar transport system ATP-binding protein
MGRAIIREADTYLMDEPLSNLDARLRGQIRSEIARLQRELAITTLYVTHDQAEAMTLGQRVAVINQGELQQVGPPSEIYERPANAFVARFIGSPGMNLVRSSLHCENGETRLELGPIRLRLPQQVLSDFPALVSHCEERLLVGIRPHLIRLTSTGTTQNLSARVCSVEAMGHETILHLETELLMHTTDMSGQDSDTGNPTYLLVQLTGHQNFTIGEQLHVQIGVEHLCFFDHNGEAIS